MLVLFYNNLSNTSIPVGAVTTDGGLKNGNIISEIYYTPIIHWDSNYILSTEQSHGFGVYWNYIDKYYGGKNYIHAGYQVIPMKL